jgi:hypothetical protein
MSYSADLLLPIFLERLRLLLIMLDLPLRSLLGLRDFEVSLKSSIVLLLPLLGFSLKVVFS